MGTPGGGRTKIRARDVFESFFLKHHREDLMEILEEEQDVEQHYPVFVNFLTMFEEHTEVAESLLTAPAKLLPVLDLSLFRAATKLLGELKESCSKLSMKTNLHARITGLPSCPELYRDRMPRTADVGRLLCVAGTVVRRTSAKMLEYQKEFMCAKCKHVFTVVADHDQYYQLSKPGRCPNPTECYSTYFTMLTAASQPIHTKDYQELKIQEQVQKLKMGSIPSSLWVTLEDDLVDSCRPGDDVVVCGVVRRRWRPLVRDTRPCVDLVVDNKERSGSTAITEEVRQEFDEFWEHHKHCPLTGRNIILASICPEVYGLYVVKLALAVVLAGGVQRIGSTTTRIRGEAHMLLVGDPGTAKSQFLKYASGLVPRSVFTTGAGTTSTGLTVTVVREEGEWALEAGALVMADGGVCCIDEFSSVREADRAAIHEAMEQQTISVAKAGLLCKLDSRCSVLAATNPKEDGNPEETLEFIGLASPLLSRFDLVFMLQDVKNQEWDRVVSKYILSGQDPGEAEGTGAEEDWGLEKLRAYFCVIRCLQPNMTPQANEVLSRYYQTQRQSEQRSKARTTLRLLESLVRLSQGHARLMMRGEVVVQDAVVAISLLEASMGGFSSLIDINPLYTAFPHDGQLEYRTQVQVILQKLCLSEILSKEMDRLDEDQLASSRKPSGVHRKKEQSAFTTSTQKPPSTAVLHSRKDFKASVSEEQFGLDIEELQETTEHRKRPRGGAQQTLSKWVEPDTPCQTEASCEPCLEDSSDDDLEIIRPKKQKSRKEEERERNIQTQAKNTKRKKTRKKASKEGSSRDDTRQPDASPPSSFSHMDRAGQDLLKDLDDFAEDTWTPKNIKENFISAIAKFAYKKPGKDTSTKQSVVQELSPNKDNKHNSPGSKIMGEPDSVRKKNKDDNVPKDSSVFKCSSLKRSPLKEKPVRASDSTVMQQKEPVEAVQSEKHVQSPLITKKHKHFTPSTESAIAKLKCFSYSPQDDETAKTLTLNTNNREAECVNETSVHECPEGKSDINASTTHGLDVSDASHLRVSEKEKQSLIHARIKEARERRLNLANKMNGKEQVSSLITREREQNYKLVSKITRKMKDNKEESTSSHLVREEQSNTYSNDVRNRENVREIDQTSPCNSKDTGFISGMNQPCSSGNREDVREKSNFPNDSGTRDTGETDQPRSVSMRGEGKDPERHQRNADQGETKKLSDITKENNQKNVTTTSSPGNINTPPSSSSSSSTSTYFPTKPKTKHKRFCFALSEEEEEDVDLFAGPVTQARVSDSEGERQALAGKNITPQSFLLKKPLLSPSPVVGRMKLPVVSEGVGKYEALASEELDDFDFEL
ncbi:DNA helicase MCM9-like isoform X2 [Portunus trituberculatus]|uniref:DNA helicase MCM9-like isoform X2 n=1 Tax=Portunus trituberculatus TaxID=210409 RepID=UPI001E1CD8D6|nr:DNA helicase MCM9-like isoform X2 [Portunus trituberculatus]